MSNVLGVEFLILRHAARQHPLAQRRERHQSDFHFLERRQHLRLDLAEPERILVLDRRHVECGVRLPKRLDRRLRDAPMQNFALVEEFFHGAGDFLNRHLRIDAVNVIQIDVIRPQTLQRSLERATQCLGARIQADAFAVLNIPTALGRQLDLIANGLERLADEFFILIDRVDLRRVEKVYAVLDRRAEKFNAFLLRRERRITLRQPHAAQSDRSDLQLIAARVGAQNSFFHAAIPPANIF